MKKSIARHLVSLILMAVIIAGVAFPAYAANNPYAAMEERSRQAVAAAIKDGLIPPDATIYDCAYSKGEDGVTRVVRYKDKNGDWIDVSAGKPVAAQENTQAKAVEKTSEATLSEYAAEVFKLTNEAREQAGLSPLTRDDELDRAAAIRAEELSRKFSHERPDGTRFYTVMGVEVNYNYAENGGASAGTPQNQVENWLKSDGHRANILDLNSKGYTKIGIGVYQASDGSLYYCQLFYRPI